MIKAQNSWTRSIRKKDFINITIFTRVVEKAKRSRKKHIYLTESSLERELDLGDLLIYDDYAIFFK